MLVKVVMCAGSRWPGSRNIVTFSTDCTVKIRDVETHKVTTTWTLGSEAAFHYLGNT